MTIRSGPRFAPPAILALAFVLGACGDAGTGPAVAKGPDITLAVERLLPLDGPAGATYEAWVLDGDGRFHPLGTVKPDAGGRWEGVLENPVEEPVVVLISVELEGEAGTRPSLRMVMGGGFAEGRAPLDVTGYLTPNIPLEPAPGVHVLATHHASGPGDLPPRDDAGIWLYDPAGDTTDASLYLKFTPLTEGWAYGGWVVRDYGTPGEVWVSYGTFRPDALRRGSARDYTGLGPFSGKPDYERALPLAVTYPGDDWLANPLDLPVPGGLPLPFDLNGCMDGAEECLGRGEEPGISRWTHVITVEPYARRYDDAWLARPSPIRVYRNSIGEAAPEVPREIRFMGDDLPAGHAVMER